VKATGQTKSKSDPKIRENSQFIPNPVISIRKVISQRKRETNFSLLAKRKNEKISMTEGIPSESFTFSTVKEK
jgi:hypothetical protein